MTNRTNELEQLNSFLRGEISAVETYRQAIEKIEDTHVRMQLEQLQRSHRERADKLTARIAMLGGKPAEDSGAWGSFAKLVEGGAKAFGTKAALKALEEGEDHGKNDYQRDLDDLSFETRTWIQREILPSQMSTYASLNRIQESV